MLVLLHDSKNVIGDDSGAGGIDVAVVAVAFVDNLCVTGDDLDTGCTGSDSRAVGDGGKMRDGETFFEDEAGAEIERRCAARGEVVDGAIDGEVCDGAAGGKEGLDDFWADSPSRNSSRYFMAASDYSANCLI